MATGLRMLLVCLILLSFLQCSKKSIAVSSLPESLIEEVTDEQLGFRSLPQDISSSHSLKVLRTYFHFFNNQDSSINYNGDEGKAIVTRLLSAANNRLRENDNMHLPVGNETPAYDTRIQYELSDYDGEEGIFYHYLKTPLYFIKSGAKANRYDRRIIREYAVEEERTINVFILPFDPSQLENGIQKRELTAIALGHTIKLPGLFQSQRRVEDYAGMFNHETGHILGLRHSWDRDDSCADTPLHANCWNSGLAPPCDGQTSNNMMDYNAFQSAITPCQIGLMHAHLIHPGRSARKLVISGRPIYNIQDVVIRDSVRWSLPKEVNGNIIIEKDALLYCTSMVFMPADSWIEIKKGGTLVVEGATLNILGDEAWQGIKRHPKGNLIVLGSSNLLLNVQAK